MNFNNYQSMSIRTRRSDLPVKERINNAILGLLEVGEITELWKKHLYQGHDFDTEKIAEELGDILFYMAWLSDEIGISLATVAEQNIAKLQRRYPDGFSPEASISRLDTACDLDDEHNVYPQSRESLSSMNDSEWLNEASRYKLHDYVEEMAG